MGSFQGHTSASKWSNTVTEKIHNKLQCQIFHLSYHKSLNKFLHTQKKACEKVLFSSLFPSGSLVKVGEDNCGMRPIRLLSSADEHKKHSLVDIYCLQFYNKNDFDHISASEPNSVTQWCNCCTFVQLNNFIDKSKYLSKITR